MRLLLTSNGITTGKIATAVEQLTGSSSAKFAVIPTASNGQLNYQERAEKASMEIESCGFDSVITVDPSYDTDWKEQLDECDCVYIIGGNTYHLLDQARKTGLDTWIEENINDKLFIGASAGSILFTPNISVAEIDNGDENIPNLTDTNGLGLVEFEISPHTPEDVSIEANQKYAQTIGNKLIAFNDNSAIFASNLETKYICEDPADIIEFNS